MAELTPQQRDACPCARYAGLEAKVRELETENERLVAALNYLRLNDWGWTGGGSDVRRQGKAGKFASHVLGVAPDLPLGWPTDDEYAASSAFFARASLSPKGT